MRTVFLYALRKLKVPTIAWSIVMAASAVLLLVVFKVLIRDNAPAFLKFLASLPDFIRRMAGDQMAFSDPTRWLDAKYFSMIPLFMGAFAVLCGSGLLAADLEEGRMELIAASPVSRSAIFWGRAIALFASIAFVMLTSFLASWVTCLIYGYENIADLASRFLSAIALTWALGSFSVFLSFLLPSRRAAATIAGAILFAWHVMNLIGFSVQSWRPMADLTPLRYYQQGTINVGFSAVSYMILLVMSAGLLLASWRVFQRRDLRVTGEAQVPGKTIAIGFVAVFLGYLAFYPISEFLGG